MTTQPTKLRRKSISRVARDEDVHPGTVYRWLNDGILDRAGNRVRLVHSKRGGRVFIDQVDLDAFFAAISAESGGAEGEASRDARVSQQFERRADESGL